MSQKEKNKVFGSIVLLQVGTCKEQYTYIWARELERRYINDP